ncbi:MAG: restriction endonuclease [Candidatus Altiarchaeota archaeon]|nr:restriction endonuclease [Candidatus Altiarchaeota archaeon]
MMDLHLFNESVFRRYKSNSQRIRRLSEDWFGEQMYCPVCKSDSLESFRDNKPVIDFYCPRCMEKFQLKSQSRPLGNRILDGAYSTMIESIIKETQPHFFLMHYNKNQWMVKDLEIIPNFFFTESVIEKRKPLASTARRAGWVGCNILLAGIPDDGRIRAISNKSIEDPEDVRSRWRKVSFLKEKKPNQRSWITDVMWCVKDFNKKEFTLDEVYEYEGHLSKLHPKNFNIKPKIRQQLQFLRDKNYLKFLGNGRYRLIKK